MHWVAVVAPWVQGVERNLQIVPWVIGTWPPVLKVTYPGPTDHEMLHHGTFVISLWPIMSSPLLLQVDAKPPVEARKVWYSHPGIPLCQPLFYWPTKRLLVYCLRVVTCPYWCL